MLNRTRLLSALLASSLIALAGCSVLPSWGPPSQAPMGVKVGAGETAAAANEKAYDVVVFALGLIETGYRFGGKNPEAGLDCSGMVSYVFDKAADMQLTGSAADLARLGKPITTEQLRPGDLLFFNTQRRPRSHVGIYIGSGRFVHAPSSRGKVRTDSLRNTWYAMRFEEARTYFD